MIIEIDGKKLVFGMQWRSMLSQVDVHKEAREARSPYLWHSDKSVYYGFLDPADRKKKEHLKQPLYSAAVALIHLHSDVKNFIAVLKLDDELGYAVCAVHQGRPRDGLDLVITDEVEVANVVAQFRQFCGNEPYMVFGDTEIADYAAEMSIQDLVDSLEASAQLKGTKSGLVNPVVITLTALCVGVGGVHGYRMYADYAAKRQQALSQQAEKTSQQLYLGELETRRADAALPIAAAGSLLTSIRTWPLRPGGWNLLRLECSVMLEKKLGCSLTLTRDPKNKVATYKTLVAALGKEFEAIEFVDTNNVKASTSITGLPLATTGSVVDKAIEWKKEQIEFGSMIQGLSRHGEGSLKAFGPFALPPGMNVDQIETPPSMVAPWTFKAPLRVLPALAAAPAYATLTKIVVDFSKDQTFDVEKSFATMTVDGNLYAKPN
jgi:hypothetical protein